jgi:hypothetical protein
METLENSMLDSKKNTIFNKIFTFNDDLKTELLNLTQYIVLAIVPSVIYSNYVNKFVPVPDINKSSLEILFELLIQILVTFYGFFIIKHVITNIPTISGKDYPTFTFFTGVIPMIFANATNHTSFSEKVNILITRFQDLWNGETKTNDKQKSSIKVSQPISQNNGSSSNMILTQNQNQILNNQNNLGNNNKTSLIDSLPTNPQNLSQQSQQQQKYPDYNSMFQNNPTPLIDANSPGMINESFEIQPANSVLGGSFGSSF